MRSSNQRRSRLFTKDSANNCSERPISVCLRDIHYGGRGKWRYKNKKIVKRPARTRVRYATIRFGIAAQSEQKWIMQRSGERAFVMRDSLNGLSAIMRKALRSYERISDAPGMQLLLRGMQKIPCDIPHAALPIFVPQQVSNYLCSSRCIPSLPSPRSLPRHISPEITIVEIN